MPAILAIPGLSWRERRQLSEVARRPAWYRASFEESQISEASRSELAGLPRTLDIPLVVLSAGRRVRPNHASLVNPTDPSLFAVFDVFVGDKGQPVP